MFLLHASWFFLLTSHTSSPLLWLLCVFVCFSEPLCLHCFIVFCYTLMIWNPLRVDRLRAWQTELSCLDNRKHQAVIFKYLFLITFIFIFTFICTATHSDSPATERGEPYHSKFTHRKRAHSLFTFCCYFANCSRAFGRVSQRLFQRQTFYFSLFVGVWSEHILLANCLFKQQVVETKFIKPFKRTKDSNPLDWSWHAYLKAVATIRSSQESKALVLSNLVFLILILVKFISRVVTFNWFLFGYWIGYNWLQLVTYISIILIQQQHHRDGWNF